LLMEHLSIVRSSFTNFTPSMDAKMDIMFRCHLLFCQQKQSYATEIYGQRCNTCALKEIFTLTPIVLYLNILKCSINKYVWLSLHKQVKFELHVNTIIPFFWSFTIIKDSSLFVLRFMLFNDMMDLRLGLTEFSRIMIFRGDVIIIKVNIK
jgi:hypothetical protein